jgi:monothiol glutaredoxin
MKNLSYNFQEEVEMDTIDKIKKQISENAIILYMKGSPDMPQCGFSARAASCLRQCGVEFAYVDILSNPDIRQTLPQYADWPTFPQLWVQGELIGGSDIIAEMHEKGELEPLVKDAIAKK